MPAEKFDPELYEQMEFRVPKPGDLYRYNSKVLVASVGKISVMRGIPRPILRAKKADRIVVSV